MGDRRIQPLLQTRQKGPSTPGRQANRPELLDEVSRTELMVVEQREDGGIDHEWTEFLHQVERERGPSVLRDVKIADEGVESDRVDRRRAVIGKDGIAVAQKRVYGVCGW